jgi:preprotein translocase subunit SecE
MATASEASQQANRQGMDPRRLVVIFLLLTTLVAAAFFDQLLQQLWSRLGLGNRDLIEGVSATPTTLLGFALAAGGALVTYFHPKSHQLSLEVAGELMRVTWPSWDETRVSTLAVVVASLIAAAVLFGIDTFSYKVMVEWLPRLWGKL